MKLIRKTYSDSCRENDAPMKCDMCTTDTGEGIHYHAFIEGKHRWVCESCKAKLRVETEHTDE